MNVPLGFGSTQVTALEEMALSLFVSRRTTAEHASRVASYVRTLAQALGFGDEDVALFETAAALHDLGKLEIPDEVLDKVAPLTADEWSLVREHSVVGAEMVGSGESLAPIAAMIRHHHERMDGNGYPDRIAGDAIPIGARMIAIADSFDAITSDRPYREARSVEAALAELEAGADTQFDGVLVECFTALARKGAIRVAAGDDVAVSAA